MNPISKLRRLFDPVGFAKSQGMKVGKGFSIASKWGTSFGTEPYLITIGDYVRLSGANKFFTHDGGTWAFRDMPEYKDVFKFAPITIGDHTFIGYGAYILSGVNIGKRCVIGAGSVVTKSVPDGTVVAGVPAKVICSIDEYAKKIKDRFTSEGHDRKEYDLNRKEYLIKHYM